MDIFKPRGSTGVRRPTDTNQKNGLIYNQPRMAELGGLDKTSRVSKNQMAVNDRGNGKKVI